MPEDPAILQPKAQAMTEADAQAVQELAAARKQIQAEVGKVIIGQDKVVELLLTALFSRGHCLFVGVPGLAKTLLVSTVAQVLDLSFSRIQFTPDLMPSDITGTDILEEDQTTRKRFYRFIQGPIFANIILADEINRTPPKTQAALLQSMQEYQVTAGGKTYPLALPFLVFATQNPIEQEGTYPLPEAQLDRFMFDIDVEYPTHAEEIAIVKSTTGAAKPKLEKILSPQKIRQLQDSVLKVPAADHVVEYAVKLVRATRPHRDAAGGPSGSGGEAPGNHREGTPKFIKDWVSWGAGPRASQYLITAGKARALLHGRYAVSVEDVRAIAHPILRHRIVTNFQAEAEGIDSRKVVDNLLETIKP